ncbi:MAG TPA: STAS domain-containing protein [Acidimicrobiales bacterium]|nr:STAS domain-containing protein [Acidimicrobiales bacterium]
MEPFAVSTSEGDGCAVVSVRGEVDLATAPELRAAICQLASLGHPRLVVDLTATAFLDCSGVRVLVGGLTLMRAAGGELRVVCPPSPIRRTFRLTSTDDLIPMFPSLAAASA